MTPTNFQNIFWGVLLALTSIISELFQEYSMVLFLHIVSFGQLWTLVTRTGYVSQFFFFFLIFIEFVTIFSSVTQFCPTLWPHELQHVRPPCPSPTPRAYPNSCPLSQWCHPTISSSVVPFSSCPQSSPASGSFQMSQLFAWGGQVLEFPLQH